ncbi:MAG: DUF2188 domain-containing protein [Sphingomonadaceae bacterium]
MTTDDNAKPHARYAIIPHGDGWMINLSGNNYGPYASQTAAIRDAIDTAHKAGEGGYQAQVLIQGEDGRFATHWTHGKDAYPPMA